MFRCRWTRIMGRPVEVKKTASSKRRRTLGREKDEVMSVIHCIILYAAPIWMGATGINTYKNLLASTQRKGLLRICSAYRTAATAPAGIQVIAGVPPMELLMKERRSLYDAGVSGQPLTSREARENTIQEWVRR
ncbi:hypothetical protein NQ315_016501 [Exocentrus adspersus]|uniref:Uncharacterized protein n=1 Tax=Exocentrus adspersus TaxID=1586481 RepID=A0AAV8VYK3_9CUCU|nr:hypothetical protein NQ315_016501 [Exocentrus adspersus]